MKFLFVVLLVVTATNVARSVSLEGFKDPVEAQVSDEAIIDDNTGIRQRRVTCDLLSPGGYVGDTACTANYIGMGKAGGRCTAGICQCRVTTFANLWNKRFG